MVFSSTIQETHNQRLCTQTCLEIEAEVNSKMDNCIRTVYWTQRVLWATKHHGLYCIIDFTGLHCGSTYCRRLVCTGSLLTDDSDGNKTATDMHV